ncbi:MAG: hypothetical protein J7M40_01160, partial [Planctomycetes bacterium]|nr:hypothetical protein [Planctomycetota bacterium]
MLKYRLLFGTLMVLCLIGLILAGASLDGSISAAKDNAPIQGSLFCLLVVLIAFLAVPEIARLASRKNARIFMPLAIASSAALATSWYWRQFANDPIAFQLYYVLFAAAFCLLAIFLYQA